MTKNWIEALSSQEIDDALTSILEHADYDVLTAQRDAVVAQLHGSKRLKMAIDTAIAHIAQKGPEHVSCGLLDSVSILFLIACKLCEYHAQAEPEVSELERLFGLEGEHHDC